VDWMKFEDRTLSKISSSLKFQGITLSPVKLLENRERYFLVMCEDKDTFLKRKCLFLRYDQWYFYIEGMNKLPPELERRHYKGVVRKKPEDKLIIRSRPDA